MCVWVCVGRSVVWVNPTLRSLSSSDNLCDSHFSPVFLFPLIISPHFSRKIFNWHTYKLYTRVTTNNNDHINDRDDEDDGETVLLIFLLPPLILHDTFL